MKIIWLLVLVALVVLTVVRMRARIVVQIAEGRAQVVRGSLPGGLLGDLHAVAELSPKVAGRVEIRGKGTSLSVRTPGLPEGPAQRARNVVYLRRHDV
ncbi:MAG: DUF3634 family protein [Pseudomonadota bacterium]|nr:DUF3634 family protein [Pseudomonadota bacterium]